MEVVERNRPVFFAIKNASNDEELLRSILHGLKREHVLALALVALNTLHGAIGISRQKKGVLKDIKPFLRGLAAPSQSLAARKKIILSHIKDTGTLVTCLFKNLDELIWRAE